MKALRQLIFIFAAIIGLTMAISAQKNDQKKPPAKPPPPVINPGDKKPPKDPPKNPDRPKKPGMALILAAKESGIDFA